MGLSINKVIIIFLASIVNIAFGQTTNYKSHAVYIYNFAKYSQWPESGNSEFVITVLGNTKLYDELAARATSYSIAGKKIAVFIAENVNQIKKSQIVIVADGKSNSLAELMKETSGEPVMIVTEREGLFKKGAGISFFINDEGKLKFDLNLTELTKRTLTVSKSITSLAASVL